MQPSVDATASSEKGDTHWALWIGNITPRVTEDQLLATFKKFGEVKSHVLRIPTTAGRDSVAFLNFFQHRFE